MLEGLVKAGFSITGTWPMRSELSNRTVARGANALASSIVLVCRPRPEDAPTISRRELLTFLKKELPEALHQLQQVNIAPVDLAKRQLAPAWPSFPVRAGSEADGSPMPVRTALQIINQLLMNSSPNRRRIRPKPAGRLPGLNRWDMRRACSEQRKPSPKPRTPVSKGWLNGVFLRRKPGRSAC